MGPNPQETADLLTYTEEILNGKSFTENHWWKSFRFLEVTISCKICRKNVPWKHIFSK